jgi:hypothetical protein
LWETLEHGGKECYFLVMYITSEPPTAYARIDKFDSVYSRKDGDGLAFELLYSAFSGGNLSRSGKGTITGVLGKSILFEAPFIMRDASSKEP